MNGKKINQDSVQLEKLHLLSIDLSGDNPRFINEKSETFIELTESIKAQGVIVPVHVRIHPNKKGMFELLAGERRHRASAKAGIPLIPAVNHGKITDEQAFEITFTENYAREDLTPLEQGKAVVTLLEKYKDDVEAVASKMGKSIKWVRQRQALGTKLTEAWQKAFNEADKDDNLKHWTASHLQRIAALPKPIQEEILTCYSYNDLPTLKELDGHIAEILQLLSKAAFNTSAAGCVKCQKRTSCQPGLWDDTLEPEALKKNDRCLDSSCWKKKTNAWLKGEFETKKKELSGLVAITTEYPGYDGVQPLRQIWPDFIREYDFNQASKKTKGAMPGFIIYGKAMGTILWVKLRGSQSGSNTGKSAGKPTPLKERRQMLHNKRMARFLEEMKKVVAGKELSELVTPDKTAMLMSLAHIFGVHNCYLHVTFSHHNDGSILTSWKNLEKLVAADLKTIRETLWENILPMLVQTLVYAGPVTQTPPPQVNAAEKIAAIFGIDYKVMQQKITTEMQESKSWAKLNADGTPKTAKKAKGKTAKKKKSAKSKQKKGEKKNAKS